MAQDHDFTRCREEERYGIPRVWRYKDMVWEVRCSVEKTKFGRWQMVFQRPTKTGLNFDATHELEPFDDVADAITYGEEFLHNYSELCKARQARGRPH